MGNEKNVIYTDHKPLSYFMDSSLLEGIYARWNNLLCQLNVEIKWIPGSRNEIADALSRTVFENPSATDDETLLEYGSIIKRENLGETWIWKDGRGGYQGLIKKHHAMEVCQRAATVISNVSELIAAPSADSVEDYLIAMTVEDFVDENKKYADSNWFKEIYNYQRTNTSPQNLSPLEKKRFIDQARKYQIVKGELFIINRGIWKRCVPEVEVSYVLEQAHDIGGHYPASMTMKRLKDYYWPNMSKDTFDYILGCMSCPKHGAARRSQTQSPATVDAPFVMFGMDFIGPLPEANLNLEDTIKACYPQLNKFDVHFDSNEQPLSWGFSGKSKLPHMFMVVDYFSRFVWAFSCSTPDQAEAIRCLSWLFSIFGSPISIYAGIGSHFVGRSMANYLQEQNDVFIPAPSGAKGATRMVEKLNDLLEIILKKQSHKPDWHLFVNCAAYELNRRVIRHFGFSAYEILFGFQPPSSLEPSFPSLNRAQYTAEMAEFDWNKLYNVSAGKAHEDAVIYHLAKMKTRRCDALRLGDWRRRVQRERHDLGVS
ncbi:hypothetical protein K3495_g117 [Podosphaera aphanis]|nr:hypothetical protein K3495_g117 [Podosphaera aphanis]